MKCMKDNELAEKVALLKAGQEVKINGLRFKAMKINSEDLPFPCFYCGIQCLCFGDVAEVCNEIDFVSKDVWFLYLLK